MESKWLYTIKIFSSPDYWLVKRKKRELEKFLFSKGIYDPIKIYIGNATYILGVGVFEKSKDAVNYVATNLKDKYKCTVIEKPKSIACVPD